MALRHFQKHPLNTSQPGKPDRCVFLMVHLILGAHFIHKIFKLEIYVYKWAKCLKLYARNGTLRNVTAHYETDKSRLTKNK